MLWKGCPHQIKACSRSRWLPCWFSGRLAALALFTYAGEKMPWLTIHIAMPMILAAAWAFGWMIESVPWGRLAAWVPEIMPVRRSCLLQLAGFDHCPHRFQSCLYQL